MGICIEDVVGDGSSISKADSAAPRMGFLKRAAMYALIAYAALNYTSCFYPMGQHSKIREETQKEQKAGIDRKMKMHAYIPAPLSYYGFYLATRPR